MKHPDCEKLLQALRRDGGPVEKDAAAHAATCPSCAEALSVAAWLRAAAAATAVRRGLPSAKQLWWRAKIIRDLVEKESLARRATRPTRWLQWAGLGILCLLGTLFLTWQTSTLLAGLGQHGGLQWALEGFHGPAGLLLAGTVLPLAGFVALWIAWREA